MRAYYFWQMQCWAVADTSGRPLGLWHFKTEAEQVASHLTALGSFKSTYRAFTNSYEQESAPWAH